MRLPRSLRWQLTLAFTGVAAAVLLAAAVGMSALIEHAVWAPLDAALAEEAEALIALRDLDPAEDLAKAVARVGSETDLGARKFIRVAGADGRTIARFGRIPPAITAAAGPGPEVTRHATIGRKDPVRVTWYAAPDGGWTVIGIGARGHLRTLRRAKLAIAGAAAVLLGVLALLAWAITTRATGELARLAGELETVEAGSLDRRLAARNTSEVERLASVLNRLLARLEAAVGHLRRFTADAAHELRTPIAALRAHLEVALARARSPEASRDGLLDALEQTERLGRLAEDLLTLSAVEARVPGPGARDETVRLDAVVREVVESVEPVAQEQGREFSCQAAGTVAVRGAPDLLRRLLLNLVDNAFRHTPPSAAVRVSVRSVDGTATIDVTDGGPGIPASDIPHVFERFHRGRTATPGAGLGLALCREIAVRHGGQIAMRSESGRGTTVTVTLPLAHH